MKVTNVSVEPNAIAIAGLHIHLRTLDALEKAGVLNAEGIIAQASRDAAAGNHPRQADILSVLKGCGETLQKR